MSKQALIKVCAGVLISVFLKKRGAMADVEKQRVNANIAGIKKRGVIAEAASV